MSTTCTGILEWLSATECRIRQFDNGILKGDNDPLVPAQIMEQYNLRPGQWLYIAPRHGKVTLGGKLIHHSEKGMIVVL